MKKLFYPFFALVVLSTGCKKEFFDINDNPNQPTEASITPDLILPRALHATASRMATSYNFAAHWMGYWSRSGTYGPNAEQETYRITNGYQADEWSGVSGVNGWYDILADFNTIEKKAKASGEKFYEGIAKTMKTIGFMYLVDQYNNVPYTDAFKLEEGVIQPKYDKGEDIYADLFRQLDQALVLINEGEDGHSDLVLAEADIMFHGEASSWRKLINTQRLKLVVRLSNVTGFNHAAELAKVTADGFIGTGETAAVNPGYVQGDNKQNPFWDAFEENYLGEVTNNYDRANNYVLNLLRNNDDIRYQYYFDPVATACTSCTPSVPANSYFGYDFGYVSTSSTFPQAQNSSGVAGPGLSRSPEQDQWLFTSVESKFLQAEAIQRGWLAGNAEAAYEAAVRESFIWLGVPNAVATANAYLSSGRSIVDWDAAANKINLIVMQKYLALVGINNFEAWVDYRRVGVPNVPLSVANNVGPGIPLRLRYPQSEYNLNAANAAKEGNPDVFTTGVFWDK